MKLAKYSWAERKPLLITILIKFRLNFPNSDTKIVIETFYSIPAQILAHTWMFTHSYFSSIWRMSLLIG